MQKGAEASDKSEQNGTTINSKDDAASIEPGSPSKLDFEFNVEEHLTLTKEEEHNLEMIKKFSKFEWFIDIKTMGEGETFGELALVKNDPRAATIKCESDCYFGVIHKQDYDRFLKRVHNKTI